MPVALHARQPQPAVLVEVPADLLFAVAVAAHGVGQVANHHVGLVYGLCGVGSLRGDGDGYRARRGCQGKRCADFLERGAATRAGSGGRAVRESEQHVAGGVRVGDDDGGNRLARGPVARDARALRRDGLNHRRVRVRRPLELVHVGLVFVARVRLIRRAVGVVGYRPVIRRPHAAAVAGALLEVAIPRDDRVGRVADLHDVRRLANPRHVPEPVGIRALPYRDDCAVLLAQLLHGLVDGLPDDVRLDARDDDLLARRGRVAVVRAGMGERAGGAREVRDVADLVRRRGGVRAPEEL